MADDLWGRAIGLLEATARGSRMCVVQKSYEKQNICCYFLLFMFACLLALAHAHVRWAVLLARSGRFAGAVFDGSDTIAHRGM